MVGGRDGSDGYDGGDGSEASLNRWNRLGLTEMVEKMVLCASASFLAPFCSSLEDGDPEAGCAESK